MGILTIKGLRSSFSKELHERNIRQAYHERRFCIRIFFGKFAYIAPDIPLLTIILAGIIAYVSPDAAMFKVLIAALLAFSAGICRYGSVLYIAKHKKNAVESGNWDTEKLNAEKERAWKRSDFFHNVMYFIAAVFLIFYFIFGDPVIYINNHRLKTAMTELDKERITLEETVPFEWTRVYSFDPYFPLKDIERITGSKSPALNDSVTEEMENLIFMNHGRVVSSVCKRPSSTGYSLNLGVDAVTDFCNGDNYLQMDYGDSIEFEVTLENGIVNLTAVEQE